MWTRIVSAALFCAALPAAPPGMEITVERWQGSAWRAIDPTLILAQGDRLRFRVQPNFSGFLYVMDRATSGAYVVLFPSEESGRDNRIEAGKNYIVPATKGAFRITGPPGQDIVYWVISPVELTGVAPPPPRSAPPASMTPRCDDAVFRARGKCVDSTAGPKPAGDKLPQNLSGMSGAASRTLTFIQQDEKVRVSTPDKLEGPVIYELRISHR